jgi:uncharacterized protein (DUF885 family)
MLQSRRPRDRARFLLLAVLAGCAHTPPSPSPSAGPADPAALHKLFDDYYEESLALDPVLATWLGDHRYDDRMANDISEAYRARVRDLVARFEARLAAFAQGAALGGEDRLSLELLRRELSDRRETLEFPTHLLPFTHISGQPVDFPIMGSGAGVHPFGTAADYDNFVRRADDFVVWMDTAIANSRAGAERGIVHPRLVIEKLLPQLDAQIVSDPTKSTFWEPVRRFPAAIAAADRARLEAAHRKMILERLVPSYERLRTFLHDWYLPRCRTTIAFEAIPGGPAWYAFRVRQITTTKLSPDEIFRIGESEVARIEGEMKRVRDADAFRGDLPAYARKLAAAPGGLRTREALVDAYKSLKAEVDRHLPQLFGHQPRAPFEIRAIEPWRENSAPSQYQQASPDGSRPGVFFVNAADIAKGPMRVSETLFLHEAIPGHHFQVSLQLEQPSQPKFRRMLGYTAYVEGWALYSETLGPQLGLFRSPAQLIEHLGAQMMRAVRLVVDVGLHHRGWTRDQAIDYFASRVLSTSEDMRGNAIREVDRYIAWPAQALAYKIGQLRITELRERSKKKLDDRFDLRAFHDEVLRNGPVPLDLLETIVDGMNPPPQAFDGGGLERTSR